MPTRRTQSLPRQQDRDRQPSRGSLDEVRSFVPVGGESAVNPDRAARPELELTDDPAINTNGSER
jgi:hypothetical protein